MRETWTKKKKDRENKRRTERENTKGRVRELRKMEG